MPTATESRKLIFMTDHGSTRATARRTRRGPFALRLAASLLRVPGAPDLAVLATGAVDAVVAGDGAVGWAPTGRAGWVREVIAPRESVDSPEPGADPPWSWLPWSGVEP
jgi:hypothetical protein